MNIPYRVLALSLLVAVVGVGCGEGIALDPASVQRPPGSASDDDRGDASSVDADRDVSPETSAEPEDGSVADRRADAGTEVGRDGTSGDTNDVDSPSDVSGDVVSDVRMDASVDGRDVSLDALMDASLDANDASVDVAGEGGGDVVADIGDVRFEPLGPSSDIVDADSARDASDGCTVDCWPAADYYVDASAPLGGDGTKLHPFKTITAAIQAHQGSPGVAKKAYVAQGTYDEALGESFPLFLRGLSLVGAGRDLTFIVGVGAFDHTAEGGPFDRKWMTTAVVGDPTLLTQIEQISMRAVGPVPIENFIGIFCDRGDAADQVASPAGQTRLDRVQIGPGYQVGVAAVTSTQPSITGCELVMTASVVTGVWYGIYATGCDWNGAEAPVTIDVGGDRPASGNTFSWMQSERYPSCGIAVADCVARGSIQYNAFVDSMCGISGGSYIDAELSPQSRMSIRHNTFERLSLGGVAGGTAFVEELSDNRFVGISAGGSIPVPGGGYAVVTEVMHIGKVRRNQFIGNDNGIRFESNGEPGTPFDLGTVADPGGNDFRCNSSLLDYGADLQFYGLNGAWTGTILAVGNAWDHAPPTIQRVDLPPNGSDIAVYQGDGVNFDTRNATLSTAVCPDGRVPGQ